MSGIDDWINTFNEMGTIKKILVGCCAVYLILMIIMVLGHAILGIPIDSYTEETPTKYKDFAQYHNSEFRISQADLKEMFKGSDQNLNGLLIGGEYDHYVIKVKGFIDKLKSAKEKAQREAKERAKNSSSSSSDYNPFRLRSGSNSDGDGAETCPYCGSEAIYPSGNGYRCQECGNYISNPDDLNLNYEEGYYELYLAPMLYSINGS